MLIISRVPEPVVLLDPKYLELDKRGAQDQELNEIKSETQVNNINFNSRTENNSPPTWSAEYQLYPLSPMHR
jgi:hypothetical protein